MKTKKHLVKNIVTFVMAIALVIGMIPVMPGSIMTRASEDDFLWLGNEGKAFVDTKLNVEGIETSGSNWYVLNDEADGGKSKVVFDKADPNGDSSTIDDADIAKYHGISGTAIMDKGEYGYKPYVYICFDIVGKRSDSGDPLSYNVSEWGGLSIAYECDCDISLELGLGDTDATIGYARPSYSLSKDDTKKTISWSDFKQPIWYKGSNKISGEEASEQLVTVMFKIQASSGSYHFRIGGIGSSNNSNVIPDKPEPLYTITYNGIEDATFEKANPDLYTQQDAITLNNPSKVGYEFTGWTGTGLDEATTSVTIPQGSTGNRVYTATWTPVYNITTSAENGTITVKKGDTEVTAAKHNDTLTLTATPDTGYKFVSWTVKDKDNNDIPVTDNTFTMPDSGVTVNAVFALKEQIEPTVTLTNWVYGDMANEPVVTGNPGNGEVTYFYKLTNDDSAEFEAAVPTIVGDYTIAAIIEETKDYFGGEATAEFSITTRPLTITTGSDEKVYDGTPLTKDGYTISETGLAGGDKIVEGSIKVTGSQTEVGSSDNTASGVVIKNGDTEVTAYYNITYNNGKLTVTKATGNNVTVSITGWTYGDDANSPSSTADFGADNVVYTYSDAEDGTYTSAVPTNAGTYWVKAGIAGTDSYPAGEAKASFTISQKAVEASAVNIVRNSGYYYTGEQVTVPKEDLTVKIGNDTIGSEQYDISYGENINAGTGTYTIKSNDKCNYTFEKTEEFVINKKGLNLSLSLEDWTYGDTPNKPVVTGNLGGGEVTYSYARGKYIMSDGPYEGEKYPGLPTDAGDYVLFVSVEQTKNYYGDGTHCEFTIKKAPVTITADNKKKVYGEDDPELTVTIAGNQNIINEVQYDIYRESGEDVGTYTIEVHEPGVNPEQALPNLNFDVTYVSGTFTVTEPAEIANGYCGDPDVNGGKNVTWALDEAGTLTISGTGAMRSFSYDPEEYQNFYSDLSTYFQGIETRDFIKNVIINDGVTNIGDYAFYDCHYLTSITLPESMRSIGMLAFAYCSSLTSITLPNSVTSIGGDAFYACESLESINIPDSVTSIGDSAFDQTTWLNAQRNEKDFVIVNGMLIGCGYNAINVTIPENVTSIIGGAFLGCGKLTTVTIPDNVTTIGDYAFYECGSLTSVYVNNSEVPKLGEGAFEKTNDNLIIYVPVGKESDYITAENWSVYVNRIRSEKVINAGYCGDPSVNDGKNVIWLLDDAGTLTISGTGAMKDFDYIVESLDVSINTPWYNASNDIKTVVINNGVTSIGALAFNSFENITSITIPESVETIGYSAFSGCSSLTDVSISEGMKSIGDYIFYGCSSLTSITIPNSVTSIGNGVFVDCNSLTSITIPASVTSIGDYAFYARNLKSVIVEVGENALTIKSKPVYDTALFLFDVKAPATGMKKLVTTKGELLYDETSGKVKWLVQFADPNEIQGTETAVIRYAEVTPVVTVADAAYTGSALQPAVTVKDGEKTLILGTDYTVSYSNNTNVGTGTVTITGKGIYYGSISQNFSIEMAAAPNKPEATMTVDFGTKKVSDIALSDGWSWADADQDKELTVGTAINAVAVYNGADKDIYADSTKSVSVSITRAACTHEGCETEIKDAKAANCTEAGYTGDTYCKTCGDKISTGTVIPALGHNLTAHATVAATCTAEGNTAYWSCDRCEKYFADAECTTEISENSWITSKIAHTFDKEVATAAYLKSAADCTHKAVYFKSCQCGEKGTETFEYGEALGHDYQVVTGSAVEVTLYTDGKQADLKCSRCHDVIEGAVIPKHAHVEETITAVAPTCTSVGYTEGKKCSICGTILVAPVEIAATDHTFDKEVATAAYLKSAADCTHKAVYYKSCQCGEKGTETFEYGEALGHDYQVVAGSALAATCTEAGHEADQECSRCHDVISGAVINATGHNMAAHEAHEATLDAEGNSAYWSCDKCGKFFADAEGKVEISEGSWVIAKLTPTPSPEPSQGPTETPTPSPEPSQGPTETPTPSPEPSQGPTETPTPSPEPSQGPTETPTPSPEPSGTPSQGPSNTPSQAPSDTPSQGPSNIPSQVPSDTPSQGPSNTPSQAPSNAPTDNPQSVKSNSITVNVTKATLYTTKSGENMVAVIATLGPENVTDNGVIWSLSEKGIVSISSYTSNSGEQISIYALKSGTVTVTAKAADNDKVKAVINIEVVEGLSDETTTTEIKDETGKVIKTETVKTVNGITIEKIITENGKTIHEPLMWVEGLEESYRYNGSLIKPNFNVYCGNILLAEKKDFTITYKNNKNVGTATIIIKFKGNYSNKNNLSLNFKIEPAVLGEDMIVEDIGVVAKKNNKTQKPNPIIYWVETGKTLSAKPFDLTYYNSENVKVDGVTEAGEYTVVVTSKESNYTGEASAKISVTSDKNKDLSKAKFNITPKSYIYTGEEIIPQDIKIILGGQTLVYGTDYEIKDIINNINPGKATIVFEAVEGNANGYVGTKIAVFTIKKGRDISGNDLRFEYEQSVPYAKGGAKPNVLVYDRDKLLTEGIDYTLSWRNNKSVINKKPAEIIVKGKGNYKGKVTLNFEITKQDISRLSVVVDDYVGSSEKVKKPKLTVTDLDGKKLSNNDFSVGTLSINEDIVTFDITGTGNYYGNVKAEFRCISKEKNIGKAKAKKIADQYFIGYEVCLSDDDLKGILSLDGKDLIPGEDFVVQSYTNNNKKGTAKVILKGINDYGGTKTLSFKIVLTQVEFAGVCIDGEWVINKTK